MGSMAPTNFQEDTFGTHEISNSTYIGISYLTDNFPVTIEWHTRSQIPNAPSGLHPNREMNTRRQCIIRRAVLSEKGNILH